VPSCPACGADIQHGEIADGTKVPLERFTEPDGDRRYRIVDLGPPLKVQMVSPASLIDAYPDHRKDCPAHGNGLG
jgi:hypothetical protein